MFAIAFGNPEISLPGPQSTTNYYIVDTDYDRFAVVYNCIPLHNYRSAQSYWLLSRTRKQTKDLIVSSRIDEIKHRFGMDENRIRRTDQSDES
jgi:Lipocalin / cytosolic fatty-acid binding protein family